MSTNSQRRLPADNQKTLSKYFGTTTKTSPKKAGNKMRQKKTRLTVETLESRNLMTVWGMAWSNAEALTVSFVPDGTDVDGHQSTLFQTFGAPDTAATWQGDILRALQTWAVNANINLRVVPDSGAPLGTPGLLQGDPRFGDIRISGAPMSSTCIYLLARRSSQTFKFSLTVQAGTRRQQQLSRQPFARSMRS